MSNLSEAEGPPFPEKVRTMWKMLNDAVEKYPDNVALAAVHQAQDLFGFPSEPLDDDQYRRKPYLRWTYKTLLQGIARFTANLRAAGVRAGMPVFTFQPNGVEFVLSS
jgi:non-ribosomal peptide synthetase component E (peptide arylation enzyme)